MRINPRVQRNSLLLLGAAVAGPALIVSGARYPGSWTAKGFLVLAGLGVSVGCYHYFAADVKQLLSGPTA